MVEKCVVVFFFIQEKNPTITLLSEQFFVMTNAWRLFWIGNFFFLTNFSISFTFSYFSGNFLSFYFSIFTWKSLSFQFSPSKQFFKYFDNLIICQKPKPSTSSQINLVTLIIMQFWCGSKLVQTSNLLWF